jgi:hypothetical protein
MYAQTVQRSTGHLKIRSVRRVISKFYTEDPQILGDTVDILVATATWRLGFVQCWLSSSVQTIHLTEGDDVCREKKENLENAYVVHKFELQH